jgi:hypothetical protein
MVSLAKAPNGGSHEKAADFFVRLCISIDEEIARLDIPRTRDEVIRNTNIKAKNNVHVSLTIIDARCVARPAPRTTDSEEHRMERKANNLGCGASLGYGEERND